VKGARGQGPSRETQKPASKNAIPIEDGSSYGKEAADLYGVTALPSICKRDWTKDWWNNDECRMAVGALAHLEIRERQNELREIMLDLDVKRQMYGYCLFEK
jgi:hypothetical protein